MSRLGRPTRSSRAPTDMIPTRAPSRAPFTVAVGITSGPRTRSRAPVGSRTRRRECQAEPCRFSPKNLFKTPLASETVSRLAVQLGSFNLEKAVAVTRTPRAEPISLAEARRRGEFESYVKCSVKVRLHPIGEGNLLCGQSHKFQFHLGIHRNSSSPRLREMPSPWNCQVERSSRRT